MKKIITLCVVLMICFAANAQNRIIDSATGAVFERVEVEAEFTGGATGWIKYMTKYLNPNVPIKNNAPIGQYQVIVRFIVSKTGAISDIVAETNHGFGMEQEVVRIIQKGPDWIPAQQNGKPVNAYRRQPVTFVVQDEEVDIKSKFPFKLVTGEDNLVTIDINKVDNDNLEMSMTNATIVRKSGNSYIVKPTGKDKAILEIYNTKRGRKKIATACFYIVPKP